MMAMQHLRLSCHFQIHYLVSWYTVNGTFKCLFNACLDCWCTISKSTTMFSTGDAFFCDNIVSDTLGHISILI